MHEPPAVMKLYRSCIWAGIRPATITWWKHHANRRRRRYVAQLMGRFTLDPDLYLGEGMRGMPQPLTHWDID